MCMICMTRVYDKSVRHDNVLPICVQWVLYVIGTQSDYFVKSH